jgi:hypothetical protein
MMPLTRTDVVQKFSLWRTTSARVQVSLEGAIVATGNQRLLTAQVDGTVRVVEPDGERTLVVVAKNNNSIRMYLTEECVFQTMTFGATELETVADVESMIWISFPTGEACHITFYHQPN